MNKLFTVLGGKFKFSAQDSDLEYLCWQCKNSPVSSDLKPPLVEILLFSISHVIVVIPTKIIHNLLIAQRSQNSDFVSHFSMLKNQWNLSDFVHFVENYV